MPPDERAALVTGATGFIGRALIARLVGSGRRVIAVSRRPAPALPAGIAIRTADLSTGAGVTPALFDDVTHIFHCAGEIRDPAVMRALHVDGTARLLAALAQSASARNVHWIQLSSVGAYGPPRPPDAPRWVDEATAEQPLGEYEVTKTDSDRLVRQAAAQGLISHSVLRPSAVVGPHMSNASLPGLIALVRRGMFFHVGPDGSIANYVHVDDVVVSLTLCAYDPRAVGHTFNLSSDCTWTALVDRIAATAGVRRPRLRIPAPIARGVARAGAMLPSFPLSPARVDVLTNRTRYPPARIEATLGFEFSRPMPAAVDDLVSPRS